MKVTRFRPFLPKEGLPLAVLLVGAIYLFFDLVLLSLFGPGNDWAPLWVAGGLAWVDPVRAYDFELVSALQEPLLGSTGERPYVYPPTALMLFAPLAKLPFYLSLVIFVAASVILFERASSKTGSDPFLLLLAPPVVLAAVAGQPTLLVTALIVAALLALPSDETRAGLLFGLAAALKPPLLLLAPFALAGGRHWRALGAAGITVAVLVGTSALLFGLAAWRAWFEALPRFHALVVGFEPLLRNTVTPYASALRLGYDGLWIVPACALVAVPVVFLAFARRRDVHIRLVALVGGALLISPYAMQYELAALAPAVAAMRLRRAKDAAVPLAWATSLFANAAVVGLLAVYAWGLWRLFGGGGLPIDDRPVERRVDIAP